MAKKLNATAKIKSIYEEGGQLNTGPRFNINPYAVGAQLIGTAGSVLSQNNSAMGAIGGGVLQGAASGSMFGPIGMGIGAVTGLATGLLKNKSNKEAAEREEVLQNQRKIQSDVANFQNANSIYEMGGSLNKEANITEYNGLPHDMGGLPLNEDVEVEDRETRGMGNTADYIFSDVLKPSKKSKKSFADVSKDIEKKYKGYENDRIAQQSKDKELTELMFEQEALKKNREESQMGPEEMEMQNLSEGVYREGGKIMIKPSKRGTFTAAAKKRGLGVQEFASKVLAHKENYSPAMVKKANFARNASKWRAEGGPIGGGDDDESLNTIMQNKPAFIQDDVDFSQINTQRPAFDDEQLRPYIQTKGFEKWPRFIKEDALEQLKGLQRLKNSKIQNMSDTNPNTLQVKDYDEILTGEGSNYATKIAQQAEDRYNKFLKGKYIEPTGIQPEFTSGRQFLENVAGTTRYYTPDQLAKHEVLTKEFGFGEDKNRRFSSTRNNDFIKAFNKGEELDPSQTAFTVSPYTRPGVGTKKKKADVSFGKFSKNPELYKDVLGSDYETYMDILQKSNTKGNVSQLRYGGNMYPLGGEIDPPEKKYLSQTEYDNEVAKRRKAYDDAFVQMLISNPDAQNDPELQSMLRQQYEQENPFDVSDIAVKQGFDYSDKTWVPSSAALSRYKKLVSQGKQAEADQVVLGHFQVGKGGGSYNPSTHSKAVELGNVKPITALDLADVVTAGQENKIKDIIPLIGGTANLRCGGKMKYPGGGELPSSGIGGIQQQNRLRDLPNTLPPESNPIYVGNEMLEGIQVSGPGQQYNQEYRNVTPENLTPEEMKKQALGDNYIIDGDNNIQGNVTRTGTYGDNQTRITSPVGLADQVQGGMYNINLEPKSKTDINYYSNTPRVGEEKYNAAYFKKTGEGFTPQSVNKYMLDMGVDPQKAGYLTNDPKLMQDYFNWIENAAETDPAVYKDIESRIQSKRPGFSLKQGIGDKDRLGQHHQWLLDPALIDMFFSRRESYSPMQNKPGFIPEGDPSIDADLQRQMLPTPPGGDVPPEIPGGGDGGEGSLKRFRPDYFGSVLSGLPNVGMGIGNFALANNLKFARTAANIYNPDYVDPTRAIQEARDQYAGAKDVIRQSAGSSGSLMSNLIGATSSQAKAESSIQSQYDQTNAGISNQAEMFNAQQKQRASDLNTQIANQEEQLRTQLKQQGIEGIMSGLNTGLNTYFASKRDADMMNIAGGENFYYRRVGSPFNQTPVKVFRGNGYNYYEDPDSGKLIYLNPETGEEIKKP